ncbi:hypothetical protein E4U54_000933, partial [Claviceps lovelessii]
TVDDDASASAARARLVRTQLPSLNRKTLANSRIHMQFALAMMHHKPQGSSRAREINQINMGLHHA